MGAALCGRGGIMADINILIVGGGGGRSGTNTGKHYTNPGGGGEVLEYTNINVGLGNSFAVVVGAGGITGSVDVDNSTDGGNSSFGEYIANGGKRGVLGPQPVYAGNSGSGKTGGKSNTTATGGSGGDAANGTNAPSSSAGGNGGAGTSKWGVYYGAGMGGRGNTTYGTAGTGYLNPGRGGGFNGSTAYDALAGIVKVKYLTADFPLGCIGGDKTTDGDYTIHTFTANGTFEVLRISAGILAWWFCKDSWEKHDKIWKPKILKPEFEI